jgi:hypothetical protein
MDNLESNQINHPFKVPDSYFENLERSVLADLKIRTLTENLTFKTDANYFDQLENQILSQTKLEELIKPEDHTLQNPAYFEALENDILGQIAIEKLRNLKLDTPSDSYFEELESNVLACIKIDELKSLKTADISDGYFDQLEQNILSQTINENKSKFSILRNFPKVFKYAAVLMVFLGLAYFGKNKFLPQDQFAEISSEEMISYLNDQNIANNEITNILSQDDLNSINIIPSNFEVTESDILYLLDENEI